MSSSNGYHTTRPIEEQTVTEPIEEQEGGVDILFAIACANLQLNSILYKSYILICN